MSRVQNDTRKIVKPKARTEGIARIMVLDLRPFDIVENVSFNELFILVTNPFSTLTGVLILSKIPALSRIRPNPEEISCSRLGYFGFSHTSANFPRNKLPLGNYFVICRYLRLKNDSANGLKITAYLRRETCFVLVQQ